MPKLELDLSPEIIEWIENMAQELETDASRVVTYLWYFHEQHHGQGSPGER